MDLQYTIKSLLFLVTENESNFIYQTESQTIIAIIEISLQLNLHFLSRALDFLV